jgi:hypothetical protein
MMDLEQLLEIFRKYLYLPDTGAVEVALGAIAANRLPGDPVWLLLVGPPSSGKTEILSSLSLLPDIHEVSTITQAGLLSGSVGKGAGVTGGLLAEIGRFGVIACKDFTSILSASPDARTTVMAALREIYDGKWIRHLGTSGGRVVAWKGKVGFIGAVTEVIDLHAATIGTMGERFVFYRLPELDDEERLELGHASMSLTGSQDAMRLELAEAVGGFLDGKKLNPELPELSSGNMESLVLLADLATKCRSSVERSGHDREIELVPQSEALGRLQSELLQLGRGLTCIGVPSERVDELLTKVALDGMSKTRRAIVDYFVSTDQDLRPSATQLANQLQLPTKAVHRALEELAAHGVVEEMAYGGPHQWRGSDWLRERWSQVKPSPNQPSQC